MNSTDFVNDDWLTNEVNYAMNSIENIICLDKLKESKG
jgi:hypothetical protein